MCSKDQPGRREGLLRTLLLILLIMALYWSFRELGGPRPKKRSPAAVPGDAEPMVQDASCGVYLPISRARSRRVGGRTMYFCSEKCEREYRPPTA